MSKSAQLVFGHVAHAGVAGLAQGSQHGSHDFLHGSQSHGLHLHGLHLHLSQQELQGVAQAHGGEAQLGVLLHGQAAIAVFIEHVAIPTAIAAAIVSFLIVIFTSLCFFKI